MSGLALCTCIEFTSVTVSARRVTSRTSVVFASPGRAQIKREESHNCIYKLSPFQVYMLKVLDKTLISRWMNMASRWSWKYSDWHPKSQQGNNSVHSNESCWITAGACSWRSCCFSLHVELSLLVWWSERCLRGRYWQASQLERGFDGEMILSGLCQLTYHETLHPPKDVGFASWWYPPAWMECNSGRFQV